MTDEWGSSTTTRASVHYCEPALGHRTHQIVRVGRVPGWFVFAQRGCILRTYGPFSSREVADAAADMAREGHQ